MSGSLSDAIAGVQLVYLLVKDALNSRDHAAVLEKLFRNEGHLLNLLLTHQKALLKAAKSSNNTAVVTAAVIANALKDSVASVYKDLETGLEHTGKGRLRRFALWIRHSHRTEAQTAHAIQTPEWLGQFTTKLHAFIAALLALADKLTLPLTEQALAALVGQLGVKDQQIAAKDQQIAAKDQQITELLTTVREVTALIGFTPPTSRPAASQPRTGPCTTRQSTGTHGVDQGLRLGQSLPFQDLEWWRVH